jgi:hypothetical protein
MIIASDLKCLLLALGFFRCGTRNFGAAAGLEKEGKHDLAQLIRAVSPPGDGGR